METKHIALGILATVLVFGAYFAGLFQGQRDPAWFRDFFRSMTGSLTLRGFAWSAALPTLWVLLYYGFIAHVWFSLGRWPRFGEKLQGPLISFHYTVSVYLMIALFTSLYVAPLVLLVCLFLRRWRHVSVYTLSYGAAVGLASCALFLAPHAFLNWLFD